MMADHSPWLLPELARSLRGLGREGDSAARAAHAAVFAPLLSARAAATGDEGAALAAMDGARIVGEIERATSRAAADGGVHPARIRARQAAAAEALAPLILESARLDALAPGAASGGPASPAWEGWTAQLGRVFAAADTACDEVAAILREPVSADPPPSRRWMGRGRGDRK